MLTAVGRGIQAFATIEQYLSSIHAELWHDDDWSMAVVALDAARSVEAKLRIVRAIAKVRLEGDALKRLTYLLEKIRDRTAVRHKLAHWTTDYWISAKAAEKPDAADHVEVRLTPSYHTAKSLNGWPDETLQLMEIQEYVERCDELTLALVGFFSDLTCWKQEAKKRGDLGSRKITGEKLGPAEA